MYPVSERYPNAARNGGVQYTTCAAYYNGAIIPKAADLSIVSGSVTHTSAPGVARTLDLEVVPVPGLFDALNPIGVQVRPISVMRYPNGVTEQVPMGVFEVVSVSRGYGSNGTIKIEGSDKFVKVQRSRFLRPQASTPSLLIREQIMALMQAATGVESGVITATSLAETGWLVWDQDRDAAINDLAESIGATAFYDRMGTPTVADLPTGRGTGASWLVDASASGVMLSADQSRDRSTAYNVVVVNSEKVDGSALFDPQLAWDDVPTSATYAGTDPLNNPTSAGPFGIVPLFYTSPLIGTSNQALVAGRTKLARSVGLSAQLSLSAVRNHALDVFDTIDVLLPQERADIPRPVERHIVDRIVHPLTPEGAQTIETRAVSVAAA